MGAPVSFPTSSADDAALALESGRVVIAAGQHFALKPAEETLLTPALLGAAKNISLSPSGVLKHAAAGGEQRILLTALMSRFAAYATGLVETLAPKYRGALERGRTSFRPAEIEGRRSTILKDDTRLHVDAFPATPMRGKRILRVFANIHPSAPRIWNVGEPFADMAHYFIPTARFSPPFLNALRAAFGVTKGPRAHYDDVVLALHDGAKRDQAYQERCPKTRVAFPPGAVWLCFTDVVMHAALKGQFALEQTFYLPVTAMADPARSPLRILEKITGRKLA